jgi:integrase
MSVRKRTLPSGEVRWLVDYRDKQGKEGKRRSRQFRTQKEAKAYETQIRGEIVAGTHVAASAGVTVAQAGKEWLEQCELEQLEASTIRQYQQHLKPKF